ncbi:MAG: hypothetical protein QOI08_1218 [Actinomycetota bacterium]|nr:hypothetical protein [Actinomycetota bacterium]
MPRSAVASVVQFAAGVLLIVATVAMPWSLYRSISPPVTTGFRSGSLGVLLLLLGAISIGLSLRSLARQSRTLQRVHLVVGYSAIVVSVVLGLRKISAANHFLTEGGGQTSYAAGAVFAVLASIAIALTSFVILADAKRATPGDDVGSDEPAGPRAAR